MTKTKSENSATFKMQQQQQQRNHQAGESSDSDEYDHRVYRHKPRTGEPESSSDEATFQLSWNRNEGDEHFRCPVCSKIAGLICVST